MENQYKKTPAIVVALAWLLVALPWAWGVTQLWKNARKLFQAPPPAAVSVVPSTLAAPSK